MAFRRLERPNAASVQINAELAQIANECRPMVKLVCETMVGEVVPIVDLGIVIHTRISRL